MEFLKDIFTFLMVRKKWWLAGNEGAR